MKDTHKKGNIGEARILFEATKRGYVVCVPLGHCSRYDLIVDIDGELNKVQVKTTTSDGDTVKVRARSAGKKDGDVIAKKYTSKEIDWLIIYDTTTDRCAFIPASELGDGRYELTLRYTKTRQEKNVRWFSQYENW